MNSMQPFLVIGVASFGISYLLVHTDGPFDIFLKLKILVHLYLPVWDDFEAIEYYQEDDDPTGLFAKLLHCFWCTTTWVSLFVSVAYILLVDGNVFLLPFMWFFSIGLSGFMHGVIENG